MLIASRLHSEEMSTLSIKGQCFKRDGARRSFLCLDGRKLGVFLRVRQKALKQAFAHVSQFQAPFQLLYSLFLFRPSSKRLLFLPLLLLLFFLMLLLLLLLFLSVPFGCNSLVQGLPGERKTELSLKIFNADKPR